MILLIQRYIKFVLLLILTILFFSCHHKNKYVINVRSVGLDLKIQRFDQGLASLREVDFKSDLQSLEADFPDMYRIFVEQITKAGNTDDSLFIPRLKKFIFDRYTQELYSDVQKTYSDVDGIEKELEYAFRHFKYYFPHDTIPQVYTLISNFGFGTGFIDNKLILSLDMFLGTHYIYYPSLFPSYMVNFLKEDYITSEALKAFYEGKFPDEKYGGEDLLSRMIYAGKELFFLDLMIPETEDSIKIRYTKKEQAWCKKFEGEIWNQLVKNKVLFETSLQKTDRYMTEGPFTNAYGIPQECPARIGAWLGWQIVRSYVEETKPGDLTEVFYEKNSRKILELSKYKPKI